MSWWIDPSMSVQMKCTELSAVFCQVNNPVPSITLILKRMYRCQFEPSQKLLTWCLLTDVLHYFTSNDSINELTSAALTYQWYGFPLGLLVHVIMFIIASQELRVSVWLPHGGVWCSSCRGPRLQSTSLCSAGLCLLRMLAGCCERSPVLHAGFTGCDHWSAPDGTMSPTPHRSPMPAVPTPTSAINILSDREMFMAGVPHRVCTPHTNETESTGRPHHLFNVFL